MAREAREKLVLDLLQKEWTAANTYDLTPKITFGWFDDAGDTPQVTLPKPEEGPINGGQTGFASITPDGSGPSQEIAGTVDVHVWCQSSDLGSASTSHPRQYNGAVVEEIQRIIDANEISPTNPSTGNQPVRYLSYQGRAPAPGGDRVKEVFHEIATIGYAYGPV